jgi:sugar lactone lactonase YvrE
MRGHATRGCRLEMNVTEVELVLDSKSELGEGALWHQRTGLLYWVNIPAGEVHIHNPADGSDRTFSVGTPVGTVVPRKSGGLALAVKEGFAALDTVTGKLTMLCRPEPAKTVNRFNDGKCDPAGRFWAGSCHEDCSTPGAGTLYCLFADHTVKASHAGVTVSNGIVWSLDARTMYYIDTPTRQVAAFDYDVTTGGIANRRVAIEFPTDAGWPDGMTTDSAGMLWIAHWDGGRVSRWNPNTGKLMQEIAIPARRVTSCAFGGADLATLYVTSARTGLSADEIAAHPHSGSMFAVRPGVSGVSAFEFAG